MASKKRQDSENAQFTASKKSRLETEPLTTSSLAKNTNEPTDLVKDSSTYSSPSQVPAPSFSPTSDIAPVIISDSENETPPLSSELNNSVNSTEYILQPKYLNGQFKLTFSKYATDTQNSNTIRFEQLFEEKGFKNAIFSSYIWEDEWFFQFIPPNSNVILIRTDMKSSKMGTCEIVNLTLPRYSCMHAKFLILNYSSFLRFVVTSANFYEYDWTGIQNIVFIQDFPLSNPSSPTTSELTSTLLLDLTTMLVNLGLKESHFSFLSPFNSSFSQFKGHLILSRPGSFDSNELVGLNQLSHVCQSSFGLLSTDTLQVEVSTSSLGSLNEGYVVEFIQALLNLESKEMDQVYQTTFQIGFPTMETVTTSHDSHISSESIFLSERYVHLLPYRYLTKLKSKVEGGLIHSKTILGYRTNATPEDSRPLGFFYAGSHNFTKAAWGWFTSKDKLMIRNYELGVIFPILSISEIDTLYPIPYQRPMRWYIPNHDVPWHI